MDHAEPLLPEVSTPVAGRTCYDFRDVPRLTAALKTGDEEAFAWLHRAWSARISRYCFALAAGDPALCEEISQAVWLRLVRHIRLLGDEAALWSWVACAARHAASDLRRTGGRYRAALERFGGWLRGRGDDGSSHDVLEADAEVRLLSALDAALAKLDADERELIEARYFSRMTLEEIGAPQALSVRAVEGRLARLRARLRDLVALELNHPLA